MKSRRASEPGPRDVIEGDTERTCATCGVELARLQANPLSQGNHTAVTPTPLRQQNMLARRLEQPSRPNQAGPKIMYLALNSWQGF